MLGVFAFLSNCGGGGGGGVSPTPTNTPPATGSLSGTLKDMITGLPVAGAIVRVEGETSNFSEWIRTGEDGKYSFIGIPTGDYSIEYNANGYILFKFRKFNINGDITDFDIGIIKEEDWTNFAGASHPFDAGKGYIILAFKDRGEQELNSIAGVEASISPTTGVSIGYIKGDNTVDWNATSTYSTGLAMLAELSPSETFQIGASKAGYTFEGIPFNVTPTPGIIEVYVIFGSTQGPSPTPSSTTPTPTAAPPPFNIVSTITGDYNNVSSAGDFLCATNTSGDGLAIYYIVDPANPMPLGTISIRADAVVMKEINGTPYAFVAATGERFSVVKCYPAEVVFTGGDFPTIDGSYTGLDYFEINGHKVVIVATGTQYIQLINVDNPEEPYLISNYDPIFPQGSPDIANFYNIKINNQIGVAGAKFTQTIGSINNYGVAIIKLDVISGTKEGKTVPDLFIMEAIEKAGENTSTLKLPGNFPIVGFNTTQNLYVVSGDTISFFSLDPTFTQIPQQLSDSPIVFNQGIGLEGDREGATPYLLATNGVLAAFSLANPNKPVQAGGNFQGSGKARGVCAKGSYVFLADGTGGLLILDPTYR